MRNFNFEPRRILSRTLLAVAIAATALPGSDAKAANNSSKGFECKGTSKEIIIDGVSLGGCYSSDVPPVDPILRKRNAPLPQDCEGGRLTQVIDRKTEKVVAAGCLRDDARVGTEFRRLISQALAGRDPSEFRIYQNLRLPDGQSMGGSSSATNALGGNLLKK